MALNLCLFVRSLRVGVIPVAAVALGYGGWAAVIDGIGPNHLIVPMMVDHPTKAQLYFDTGRGLREEESSSEILRADDELHDVVFLVPRVPLKAVRFDPMDAPGHFTIGQPRLETASGRFVAKFPMSAIVPANEIAEFRVDGKRWIGVTVPGATDSQLTFQLGGPLRVGEPRIPWIEAGILLFLVYLVWRLRPPASTGATTEMAGESAP